MLARRSPQCRERTSTNRARAVLLSIRSLGHPVIAVSAAILVCQFHKQVFQSPPDWVHCNHLTTRQPNFFNRLALTQCGNGDLDEAVLLRAFNISASIPVAV